MNESEREKFKKQMEEEMRAASEKASKETDELLEEELKALKNATSTDLEALRPKVTDTEAYNKLIKVVEEATQKNESLAQLKANILALGSEVLKVSKEVINRLNLPLS
jgi:hypothetical protein